MWRAKRVCQMKRSNEASRHLDRLACAVISFVTIGLALGCGELVSADTSLTQSYQVFGIRAEPPVVRPDDKVVVTVYDHHPKLNDVTYSWSLCLYSHGASHISERGTLNNFSCLKELSIPVGGDMKPRIVIDLSERELDLRKRLRALGQHRDTNGEFRSLEDGLDIFVVLSSGEPSNLVRSVKRIRVVDAPGEQALGANPVIKGWTVRESGVANLLDECVMSAPGPESELRFNDVGDVVAGTLRTSVMEEVTGDLQDSTPIEGEERPLCSLHNQSLVDLQVDVEGEYENDWSDQEGYTYRWYISDDQVVHTPLSTGGRGYGSFELAPNQRSAEIIFTVRDPDGGFAIGRQELLLVEGISIR